MRAGKTPVWNESLEIPYVTVDDKILVKCVDEDVVCNDLVGERELSVGEICSLGLVVLYYKGKKAAEIRIEAKLLQI